ncbi:MAG: hypothetical protein ACREFH_17680, partial [Stellaceae bacterium]
WPHGAAVVVELAGPDGAALGRADAGSADRREFLATAAHAGWHSFSAVGTGLPPGGAPFALTVSYTGTQELRSE